MLTTTARLVTDRRRTVLALWAVLFVVGMTVGTAVFGELRDSSGSSDAESVVGFEMVDRGSDHGLGLVVVVADDTVDDPQTVAGVRSATARLAEQPWVQTVQDAYGSGDPALRSTDRTDTLVIVSTDETEDTKVAADRVRDARAILSEEITSADVNVGGDLAVMADSMESAAKDLVRGELIALPILLVVLVFIFRGVRAALMPVLAALVTVAGAFLILLAATGLVDVSSYAVDVVALFGLGLAVDYSLLMVNRFREERAAGHDVAEATRRTVTSAGRTIGFSALTVAAALAGLFAFGTPTFTSLALGGIATVMVALAAGLLLVPALLATWGHRIKPEQRAATDDGFFGRLARRVQKRPVLVAVGTAAVLLLAGVPFLGVNYSSGDARTLPASSQSRQVLEALASDFGGTGTAPVRIVTTQPADSAQVAAYAERLLRLDGAHHVAVTPEAAGVTVVDVVPDGPAQGDVAQQLVERIRSDRPEFGTWVTGEAAFLIDFKDQIADRLPLAAGIIAIATFVLLFLMTGSVLVPVKALVMNTVSLGATFGALVWVFQDGNLSGLLGFTSYGAIEVWVPVIVFVFAFGLSMDYEVFLLSRIKECYDECGNSDRAVANGLQRSGRIITAAALLITIVFAGFAAGENLGIKQMGLALAVAVVVDATLVRCLLVPATMTLLGDRNWWAPAPLRRVHQRFGLHEAPSTSTAPAAVPAQRQPEGQLTPTP
jgi:putative drug exporter of the RND superfamily